MLLAEALAARKDATSAIDALRDRLAAAVLRYEDEDATGDAPAELVAELERSLDRFESLTVRINLTNNATRFAFDGRELSVMEAIALRERLSMGAKARRKAVEALERAVASVPYGRVGVVAADIDLDEATRELALRWAPERNREPGAVPT